MFVYNTTIKVNKNVAEEWMKWKLHEHIPEIMDTGFFTEFKFFKLLEQDDLEGFTYVIQYFMTTKENYKKYIDQFSEKFKFKAQHKWADNFIAFQTIMELIK